MGNEMTKREKEIKAITAIHSIVALIKNADEKEAETALDTLMKGLCEDGSVDEVGAKITWAMFHDDTPDFDRYVTSLHSHMQFEKDDPSFEPSDWFALKVKILQEQLVEAVEPLVAVENESRGIVQIITKPHGSALVEIYDTSGEVPQSLLDLLELTINTYYEGRS